MLKRTHLAVGLGVALYFLPFIKHPVSFIPIVLIASLIPELGNLSHTGEHVFLKSIGKIFSPFNKILRSYTLLVAISIILALFYPILALPFFLGYSFTLSLDTFTKEGIQPFWPSKKKTSGHIETGNRVDRTIFYVLIVVDIALLIKLFI
jgi:membrane-bound metal-dependent hydrolase YbcI (DUF457 family)